MRKQSWIRFVSAGFCLSFAPQKLDQAYLIKFLRGTRRVRF